MSLDLLKMPLCHWLLEDDIFDEGLDRWIEAIRAQGMQARRLRHVPFSDTDFHAHFAADACVVAYGSLQLIEQVRKHAHWRPGCYASLENYLCTAYYPVFGAHLLNARYIMLPYGEIKRQRDFLLQTLGNNGCLFVRPNSVAKLFAGQIIAAESFDRDVDRLGFYDVTPDTVVVVAEPQNIVREWRVVIVAGEPISASQYRAARQPSVASAAPQVVFDWCRENLKQSWQPDSCWTLDICEIANGDLKLLEIGTFSSAGLYACDPGAVVAAVSQQAERDWEQTPPSSKSD